MENSGFFRVSMRIGDAGAGVKVQLFAPRLYRLVNVRSYLAANDGAHKSHQPFGFAQLTAADRLHHHHEGVMNPVVQILHPQLAAQVKADAF